MHCNSMVVVWRATAGLGLSYASPHPVPSAVLGVPISDRQHCALRAGLLWPQTKLWLPDIEIKMLPSVTFDVK